jgi:hypothetical protein
MVTFDTCHSYQSCPTYHHDKSADNNWDDDRKYDGNGKVKDQRADEGRNAQPGHDDDDAALWWRRAGDYDVQRAEQDAAGEGQTAGLDGEGTARNQDNNHRLAKHDKQANERGKDEGEHSMMNRKH